MKVNDCLIPYLKGVLQDPFSLSFDNPRDPSSCPKNPDSADAFLSYDAEDYRKIAELFRKEISGGGKRKQELINVFEKAAELVDQGDPVFRVVADTQDRFSVTTDLTVSSSKDFYKSVSQAVAYRQPYPKSREWGYGKEGKVKDLVEDDRIKKIKKQVNSFLEYQRNEFQVIALRKYAEEVEAKAKEQRKKLYDFDFAKLEKLIDPSLA